jgi:undecaprenyl-diphosphatase
MIARTPVFNLLSRLDARDRQLFTRLTAAAHPSTASRRFWTALTHLGGTEFSIAAATAPFAVRGDFGSVGRPALATLVISHLIVQCIKRTVGRRRPARQLGIRALVAEPVRFSFPSGHSAAAMSVAFGYSIAFPSLAVVLLPLAFLVGMSRVCLGVHYPSDVFVGQLIAALSGVSLTYWFPLLT